MNQLSQRFHDALASRLVWIVTWCAAVTSAAFCEQVLSLFVGRYSAGLEAAMLSSVIGSIFSLVIAMATRGVVRTVVFTLLIVGFIYLLFTQEHFPAFVTLLPLGLLFGLGLIVSETTAWVFHGVYTVSIAAIIAVLHKIPHRKRVLLYILLILSVVVCLRGCKIMSDVHGW